MRRVAFAVAVLLAVAGFGILFAQNANIVYRHVPLPTSKTLIGVPPGVLGSLNGFTPTMVVSPDQRYAALLNDGYGTQRNKAHQSIAILDLSTNQIADFPEDRLGDHAHQSYFVGLAFSTDGRHLYASVGSISDPVGEKPGDTGNGIAVYSFEQGKVAAERFLNIPPQKIAAGRRVALGLRKTAEGTAIPYPAGMAVIAKKGKPDQLLVADNYADNVVLLDSASGRILKQFDLSTHQVIPSSFPYAVVASRNGRRAWCSLWNASRVAELDLVGGKVRRWISVMPPRDPLAPGSHPTALLLSPDEKLLYVTLANADRVVAIPTGGTGPMYPLSTNISGQSFGGTCPDSLAISGDGARLFVADACLNAVAVFDVAKMLERPVLTLPILQALGFIPTGWYPSAVASVGDDLLIATSKGQGTGPNSGPGGTDWEIQHHLHPYIPTLLYGSLARVNAREIEKQLPDLTEKVKQSNLIGLDPGSIAFTEGKNPIRHVIYIIKENRTYDQVLGDLKVGNGDSSLTMYGTDVTPNEHKLALQFGVLDNFYDSGEVSGDGHEWSTAAITSDYNENTWQINYRGRERTYDFQGLVADELPLENKEPDVDAPTTGYIWDNVSRHGLSYRDYGEFVSAVWCQPTSSKVAVHESESTRKEPCPKDAVNKGEALPQNVGQPRGTASPWPWAIPMFKMMKPTKAVLRDHFDARYPDFDTEYPDQLRADEFLNEFDSYVRARNESKGTELPVFVLLYLPNDHTHGTTPEKPRPAASVADNDLAVGRVVEAVTHSPYWDDTAIFIVEDDAQNGADHVDAHRSTAFVISKYSPGSAEQPFVAHGFYTTVNMIHTIEALLGLPPMNQNDAYAPVMAPLFSGAGNQPPFTADWSNRDNGLLYQINPPKGRDAAESLRMDFSRPDAANAEVLNAILWRDRKGNVPMPVAKHAIVPQRGGAGGARDDD